MGLSFPSRIGDQVPASPEASQNLTKLLRADLRGRKEQVTTGVALQCFQRIKELNPGYLAGIKSWVKSGCVYALGGTATIGALAASSLGIYALGKKAIDEGYGVELASSAAALLTSGWLASELGYRPVGALAAFVGIAVRDSANRAANWSIRQDERSIESKEQDVKQCHQEILNQLTAVYNDCAKLLQELYEVAEKLEQADQKLQLKKMINQLDQRLPAIEKLLRQLNLSKYEVELVLQRLKDKIKFLQSQICSLSTKSLSKKMNAEMIAGWSKKSIHEIAVPTAIKDRIEAARQTEFGMVDQFKGYGSALVSGVKALATSTLFIAGVATAAAAYRFGANETISKIQNFVADRNFVLPEDSQTKAIVGAAAVAVVTPPLATLVNKWAAENTRFQANASYVKDELTKCVMDLKNIYSGVKNHVLEKNDPKLTKAIRERLPSIIQEIENLDLVVDPAAILSGLESI